MKIQRREGSTERKILIGMIVDSTVLARISTKWEKEIFKSKWANLIGKWCVNYFEKYGKAPLRQIESLFHSWEETARNKDDARLIEKFLEQLSNQYKALKRESNTDYITDLASKHFNEVKLSRLADNILADLANGEAQKAWDRVNGVGKVEVGQEGWVDILRDRNVIKEAFTTKNECLVKYPGAIGKFFGSHLARDCFVAIWGYEKRGKSWILQDMAWRAMEQGRRVAYFEVGDLSRNQVMRRFMVRASKRPLEAGEVKYPRKIERDPDSTFAEVTFKDKKYTNPLSWKRAFKNCSQVIQNKLRTDECLFRLSVHPNDSISVNGIKSILKGWERTGWIPDVVVIDYADILAPNSGSGESRDQINATWKGLRSLSQAWHCLVLTASQTDANSYDAATLSRSNFSEDKRKLAHVTGTIGLNATEEETDQGILRLNWIVLREGKFSASKCVHIAGCLELANPCVRSTF